MPRSSEAGADVQMTGLELLGPARELSHGFAVDGFRIRFSARYNFSFELEAGP
jgi:hypothetical protein